MMPPCNTAVLPEDHMLQTSDLDYDLPRELIATTPAEPRDSSRLLVVKGSGEGEHAIFRDLPEYLRRGDRLVLNTSKVLPARLLGVRRDTGGKAEALFLEFGPEPGVWVCLVKARRFRDGAVIDLESSKGGPSGHAIELIQRHDEVSGAWLVRVLDAPVESDAAFRSYSMAVLDAAGRVPLPPYIRSARRSEGSEDQVAADMDRYQTVYAEVAGSVAAPTAGLHFTPAVLEELSVRGILRRDVTLHVGAGTFREVETDTIEAHPMHRESCWASPEVLEDLRGARKAGHRVVAVGTTAARTLEASAERSGGWLETDLLITPGYQWKLVDAMVTNFHLPRSTLMAMIAALLPGGVEQLHAVYRRAIEARYRFYSYGDAMLVLPEEPSAMRENSASNRQPADA